MTRRKPEGANRPAKIRRVANEFAFYIERWPDGKYDWIARSPSQRNDHVIFSRISSSRVEIDREGRPGVLASLGPLALETVFPGICKRSSQHHESGEKNSSHYF